MTTDEFQAFAEKLDGLWPGKVNPEQLRSWRGRVMSLPEYDAMGALDDYYAGDKKAADGPQPALAGYLRAYYKRTAKHQKAPSESETFKPVGFADFYRSSGRFAAGTDLTDSEIELRYYHQQFLDAVVLYGPEQPAVRAAFNRWQARVERDGGRRVEWDAEEWQAYRERHRPARDERSQQIIRDAVDRLRLAKQRADADQEQAEPTPTGMADEIAEVVR